MRFLKDGTDPIGPVALQTLESDPPEYGTPRAKTVTVDLNAMSTLDPALEAMYEASEGEAKTFPSSRSHVMGHAWPAARSCRARHSRTRSR